MEVRGLAWADALIFHIKEIRASVMQAFRMPEVVWIEHRGAVATDGGEEALCLVNFPPGAGPERKPLDRASVERLVGRELG